MIYRSSDRRIKKVLAEFRNQDRRARRLELDIADLLVGPTSGAEAERLSALLLASSSPEEVAKRLKEIAERYLGVSKTEPLPHE